MFQSGPPRFLVSSEASTNMIPILLTPPASKGEPVQGQWIKHAREAPSISPLGNNAKFETFYGIVRLPVSAMWRKLYRPDENHSSGQYIIRPDDILILPDEILIRPDNIVIRPDDIVIRMERYTTLFTWHYLTSFGLLRQPWFPAVIHTKVTFHKVCLKLKKKEWNWPMGKCDISTI